MPQSCLATQQLSALGRFFLCRQRTLILPQRGCYPPGEALDGEENKKAVDEASAVASGMEEGSCGKAPAQGQQLTWPRSGSPSEGKKGSPG